MDRQEKGLLMGFFLFIVSIIFGTLLLCEVLSKRACTKVGKSMETSTIYLSMTGCMIEVDGRFIPYESYRVVR